MERSLSLSENIYQQLLAVAQRKGVSPQQWIATQLSEPLIIPLADCPSDIGEPTNNKEQSQNGSAIAHDKQSTPLSELLSGLTGTVSSKTQSIDNGHSSENDKDDAFGDAFIAKMAKQGIHLP